MSAYAFATAALPIYQSWREALTLLPGGHAWRPEDPETTLANIFERQPPSPPSAGGSCEGKARRDAITSKVGLAVLGKAGLGKPADMDPQTA